MPKSVAKPAPSKQALSKQASSKRSPSKRAASKQPASKPAALTRLGRALREPGAARVTPLDLFRLARRGWVDGERLDIGALAAQLGIGRATAFRWVGSREQLLGEVIWSLCEPLLDQAAAASHGRGAQRVAATCEYAIRAMLRYRPLRRFIELDAEFALRLMTSKHGPLQARVIDKVRGLLQFESERGALELPLNIDTLAYLVVRLAESFIYADVISDQRVDPADAGLAIELLLSGRVERRVAAPVGKKKPFAGRKR